MRDPLHFELHGGDHEPNYVRVYECEHITDGTYPVKKLSGGVLHVGEHASIAVCAHCWQHVTGMVLQEMVQDKVRSIVHRRFEEIMTGPKFLEAVLREVEAQEKVGT